MINPYASIVALCSLWVVAECAHSARRRTVFRTVEDTRYDRSITTFSADGRLRQVEYGMEASRRGNTIAAVKLSSETEKDCCFLIMPKTQDAVVHRIDAHVLMVATGYMGDGRFLASHIRQKCRNHRLQFGEAPTVKQVAQMVGAVQHLLTLIPGARPLGCVATVVGVEGTNTRLFQSGPGGVVEEYTFCTAGRGHESVLLKFEQEASQETLEKGSSWADVATKIGNMVLDSYREEGKSGDEPELDIWTMSPCQGRRGSCHIQCAKSVSSSRLSSLVEELLNNII
mmetsp:Transcript_37328/g.57298  ORF Transcript_37328/g.57298 Transcript_37328/m.57298 type:complete len:285 (+) Transcript_37328:30-884(+)